MAPLSGLAAAGTWLASHLPGLQVRGEGARPSGDWAPWLPLIPWRLPALSPELQAASGGQCSGAPRTAASSCPLPPAQPELLPGLPSCQVPRTGQSRREAEGGSGPQGGSGP